MEHFAASVGSGEISEAIRRKVCETLSTHFSRDNVDLVERCAELLAENAILQEDLRLKATVAETSFLESRARIVAGGEETSRALENSVVEVSSLLRNVEPFLADDQESLAEAEKVLQTIRDVEKRLKYLKWLQDFQDQSDRIRSSLACGSVSDSLTFLLALVDWCKELRQSKCTRLVNYLHEITLHWTQMVSEHVAQDFPQIFTRIGYPCPPSAQKALGVKVDSRSRSEIDEIVRTLLRMRLPDYIYASHPENQAGFLQGLLPLRFFIMPLEKRFRFHFYITEKTSRLDKPEWYFTQLVAWIRDYADFVGDALQSVFRSEGMGNINAKSEFVRGLALLGRGKFLSSIPLLVKDESLFAHAMDEVLSFAKLMNNMGYYSAQETFSQLLIIPEIFEAWFHAEKLLAEDRLHLFLSSGNAWKCQFAQDSESPDDFKVPECANQFVTMLRGITDRYELMPSKELQLKFLELQMACVEDFNEMMRLGYEEKSEDRHFCSTQFLPALVNAERHIYHFLMEMESSTLVIQLLSPSVHCPPSAAARFSEHLASDYAKLLNDCQQHSKEYLSEMKTNVMMLVRGYIKDYGRLGWKNMSSLADFLISTITPVMGDFIYKLKTIFSAQKECLLREVYDRYIADVMLDVDNLLYSEVISRNVFSTGGAAQLNFDLKSNFVFVIQRITDLPHAGISRTMEASKILSESRGTAMLLAEKFDTPSESDKKLQLADIFKTLSDLQISSLRPEEVNVILRKRSDLEIL